MGPPISEVWAYFQKRSDKVASCKRCFKEIKYSGNTSNLHKHLKMHNIFLKKKITISKRGQKELGIEHLLRLENSDSQNVDALDENCCAQMPSTSSNVFSEMQTKDKTSENEENQPLKAAFKKIHSHQEGGLKYETITMSILYFICKDIRPFNIIEGEGFLKLLKEVAPFYKVPSSTCMKKKLCEKYDVTKLLYKERIQKASEVCLTLDVWTETMAEKSFLGVTAHFLEGINIFNCNIATRQLNNNHTAEYLGNTLTNILDEWSIPISQIRCIITDNGANMVAAVKTVVSDKKHLPCFPHTLNLIVDAALKNESIKKILSKVREIVKWVKNSVVNSDKLRNIQQRNGVPEGSVKKFILDVKTRWNSVYYMIQRFLELKNICTDLLFEDYASPEILLASEIEILKQLTLLLKPFEFVSKESSGENYVTLSKIIPMINSLKIELLNFSSTFECIIDVQKTLKQEINRRFGFIEYNTHAALATLLDPRFKNIHFQDANACGRAIQKLKELVKSDISNPSSESEAEKTTKIEYDFWKYHKELAITQQKRKTINKGDELAMYLSSPVSSLKSSPLEEWEDKKLMFPSLYIQARMFLVVVASSVPCERLFSKAGATITKNRNRLLGKHLEKLLFLGSVPQDIFFS